MNKTLWRATLLAGLLVSGLLACAQAPASPEADRAALGAAMDRWSKALMARDTATLATLMTDDVELLDGTSVKGRDAATRALGRGDERGQLTTVTREISVSQDIAWHLAGLARTQANGDVRSAGFALEIWKREGGQWKLHRRMVTGGPRPDVSLTRPSTKEPALDR